MLKLSERLMVDLAARRDAHVSRAERLRDQGLPVSARAQLNAALACEHRLAKLTALCATKPEGSTDVPA
jgi:hypothetical protein